MPQTTSPQKIVLHVDKSDTINFNAKYIKDLFTCSLLGKKLNTVHNTHKKSNLDTKPRRCLTEEKRLKTELVFLYHRGQMRQKHRTTTTEEQQSSSIRNSYTFHSAMSDGI